MPRILPFIFPLLTVSAVGLVWLVFVQNGGLDTINDAISRGTYPDGDEGVTVFTGVRAIDDALMSLVAFNLPVVNANFAAGRVFMVQFLGNVMIIPFIISIEAQRGGKGFSLSPILWGLFSQLGTSAVALPLYCFVQCVGNDAVAQRTPTNTGLSPRSVTSTFLGHVLGYALPAWMMFDPLGQGPDITSLWTLAFALFPLGTAISSNAVHFLLRLLRPRRSGKEVRFDDNHSTLRFGYALIAVAAAISHGFAVLMAWGYPEDIRGPILSLDLSPDHLQTKVLTFLEMDYLITFAALLAWAYIELRRAGHSSFKLIILLAMGTVAFGPGATTAVAWSVRERSLRARKPKAA